MKALRHPIILAVIALAFTSCYSSQGYVYSHGHDDYGYYGDDYYYDDDRYYGGQDRDQDRDGVSFSIFYNELSPHGRWINNHNYGRIWVPRVGRDFHPYATNGYWVMTDYGNTWVSNYSWGWAPFHYGRWLYDDFYGWAWVPGYEWAPAWVSWRSGGGYYGWAPMGPRVNISIHINIPSSYWTFLPSRYMYHRSMHRYYNRYSPTIYNRTTIINNTYIYNDNRYYSGPSARDYERETGRKATVRRLESTNNRSGRSTRVSNNAVSVYRPDANSGRTTSTRPAVSGRSINSRSSNSNTKVSEGTAPRIGTSSTSRNTTVRSTESTTRSNSSSSRSRSSNNNTRVSEGTAPRTGTSSTSRNTTVRPTESTTRSNSSSSRSATATPQRSTSSSSRSNRESSTVRSTSGSSSRNNSAGTSSSRSSSGSSRSGRSSGRR